MFRVRVFERVRGVVKMRFPSSLMLDFHGGSGVNLAVFRVVNLTTRNRASISSKKMGLISRLARVKNKAPSPYSQSFARSQFGDIWTIHFLRKEYLYTKLKYSRTPSYDIVSGGLALLFAGLLGFLTTEKFGFELVDSGDFYVFGMYVLLTVFPLRLLLKSAIGEDGRLHPFNYRGIILYIQSL
jgi:hypothetical protein